jgi:hypothetical protein
MTTLPLRRTHKTVVDRMRVDLAGAFNFGREVPRRTVAGEDFRFDMLKPQV